MTANLLERLDATRSFLACSGLGIVFLAETQKLSAERNVHILREPVDETIDFRERGAALQYLMVLRVRHVQELIQRFTDPVILLHNRGNQAA